MYLNNKVLVGKTEDNKELSILLNKANRHGIITGASGSGKTISLKVMAERRATFKEIVDGQFREWDSAVTDGLMQLVSSSWSDSYSLHGMVAGLDKILSLCDESAAFHTVEEYEAQLDQTLNLCF